MQLRTIFVVGLVTCLSACSSLMLSATTTDVDDLIAQYSTRAQIQKKFGPPILTEEIPSSHSISHILTFEKQARILVDKVIAPGAATRQWPAILWSTREEYEFEGSLRNSHDAGEATSLALMTFGASELMMLPYAAGKASTRRYVVSVWYDANGVAVGFSWKDVSPRK